jgi:hypothetical protein
MKIIAMKGIKLFVILLITVALSATACYQGEQERQETAGQSTTLLFQATFADETGTKTQYDDGGIASGTLSMHWCVGDQINLFFDNTRATSPFTATITEPASRTGFTGQIDFATGVDGQGATAENFYFYAYYPYGGTDVTINNGVVTATLPAEQPSVHGNNIASGLLPWAAKSENLMLTFYQPASVMRFKLTTENVQYVELSGKNHEKIAGTYSFNFSGTPVRPEVSDRASGVETIRLNAPDNGVFNTNTWYYLVLLPTEFTQGLTLKAYTGDDVGTCVFGAMTFNKAKYKSYTEDSRMEWTSRTKGTTLEGINWN